MAWTNEAALAVPTWNDVDAPRDVVNNLRWDTATELWPDMIIQWNAGWWNEEALVLPDWSKEASL